MNMASVGGFLATPGASIYVASKHAVIGLTKSAAIEYGPHGIRVNAISPAAIRTDMLRQAFGHDAALDELAGIHPIRRIGSTEDVADAVAWLFSEYSSYYTGQSLVLDGGLTAQRPFVRSAGVQIHKATKTKSQEKLSAEIRVEGQKQAS